ncbi:hypothetical protein OG979_07805 [Actinomadura citrea]|uniref:hypothetical protein n=1 Tax=Actinomadura citrea TaxID=46158 RepID=UPI002E2C7045|nr:hypothetical protein [Actinomadura citrea]
MVSAKHEGPIQIIRDNPEVVAQLLTTAFQIELSKDLVIRTASEEFTNIAPTAYRADNVIEICEGDSARPSMAVVVEVQQRQDPAKRRSWPVYLTTLRARTRCPCYLLVICPERPVAKWARESIKIGHPGFDLQPLVVGPGVGPLVATPEQAARTPEMTIVGTLANVTTPDREAMEITHAALVTIENAGHENADLYTDLVLNALPKAARRILEELVNTGIVDYEFKSDLFLRSQAKGKVRGEAESVLKVLDARGLSVSDEVRKQVLACTDQEQLDQWLVRAITVEHVDQLFG